jgi:hypothetical protein
VIAAGQSELIGQAEEVLDRLAEKAKLMSQKRIRAGSGALMQKWR